MARLDIPDREGLQRFAREHHVHYDVEPEIESEQGRSEVTGFGVRLLAAHGAEGLPTPACPRCLELLSGLRAFAERLVSSAGGGSWTEIVPEPAVLHESHGERGADEVALTVRVRREPGGARAASAVDDPHLTELRNRLEAVGVERRA